MNTAVIAAVVSGSPAAWSLWHSVCKTAGDALCREPALAPAEIPVGELALSSLDIAQRAKAASQPLQAGATPPTDDQAPIRDLPLGELALSELAIGQIARGFSPRHGH